MAEIEAQFTERFARDYFVNPKVSVQLDSKKQAQIVVNGQVAKPGVYDFDPRVRMTVLTAIARAGGFTDIARESGVKIIRVVDGKEQTIPVNAADLLSGKKSDVVLLADDLLWVPESKF